MRALIAEKHENKKFPSINDSPCQKQILPNHFEDFCVIHLISTYQVSSAKLDSLSAQRMKSLVCCPGRGLNPGECSKNEKFVTIRFLEKGSYF